MRPTAESLIGAAAAQADAAYLAAMRLGRGRAPLARRQPAEALRRLAAIARDYTDAPGFFRPPRPLTPMADPLRSLADGGTLWALSWSSAYEPWLLEMEGPLASSVGNGKAWARLWAHPRVRPVVILLHGYGAGRWAAEARLWGVPRLYEALDVVQFVLPYHGPRREPRRVLPRFPSADPRRTNEAFRQVVGELRDLIGWLRRRGHPRVSLAGLSLGAYTAALTATVEPAVDDVLLHVPLACLADYARDHRLLARGRVGLAQHAMLTRAHAAVAPLERPPAHRGRTQIIAAHRDRITRPGHARRLADHFGAPLTMLAGGHLAQAGRAELLARMRRFLAG